MFKILILTIVLLCTNAVFSEKMFEENELLELEGLLYSLKCENDTGRQITQLSLIANGTDVFLLIPETILDKFHTHPRCNVSEMRRVVNRMKILYQKIIISHKTHMDINAKIMNRYIDYANNTANYLQKFPLNNDESDLSRFIPNIPIISERCNERMSIDENIFTEYDKLNGRKKRNTWTVLGNVFAKLFQKTNNKVVGKVVKWTNEIKYRPWKFAGKVSLGTVFFGISEGATFYLNDAIKYTIEELQCMPSDVRSQYCNGINVFRSEFNLFNYAYNSCTTMLQTYEIIPTLINNNL